MTVIKFKNFRELVSRLEEAREREANSPVRIMLPGRKDQLTVNPSSLCRTSRGGLFIAGCFNSHRALFVLGKLSLKVMGNYEGIVIFKDSEFAIKKCRVTRTTFNQLRNDFPCYAPAVQLAGSLSLSAGDVLGLAGNAHLKAFTGKANLVMPSHNMHQMQENEIQPEDSLDAASWAAFMEGYRDGFSSEAWHIWKPEDVRKMLQAGYTRLSIGPGEQEIGHLRDLTKKDLVSRIMELPWIELRDKFELVYNRYRGVRLEAGTTGIKEGENDTGTESASGTDPGRVPLVITPQEGEILSAIAIYSEIILKIVELERIICKESVRDNVTLEVSFANCGEILTPFEHYFIINELLRHDVQPDYLAPGSLSIEHMLLAKKAGDYGLSGHFNSSHAWQRFVNEELISGVKLHGRLPDISYITALRCIAADDIKLFRIIWETSRNHFENARIKSGTSLRIDHIESDKDYNDDKLPVLAERIYAEEFFTLTMPEILTLRDSENNRSLRNKLYHYLLTHHDKYTEALIAGL